MGVSGQCHAPAACFTPRERTPGTHWIEGWVGLRAGLGAGARRKILFPCRETNPDRPARSQTLYCLSYRGSSHKSSEYLTVIMETLWSSHCGLHHHCLWGLFAGYQRLKLNAHFHLGPRLRYVVLILSVP
jgi:hypothetical protein